MRPTSIIGQRIAIVGSSGSGKSTLGEQIAELIGAPFVELDALYWKPGWVGSEHGEFLGKVEEATAGDAWVVAGNYTRTWPVYWGRADTVVWLDLPLRVCLARLVRRSWQRSRERELLWGTNTERFWPQLKLWAPNDSLLAWTVSRRRRLEREVMRASAAHGLDRRGLARLRSPEDVEAFVRLVAPERTASRGILAGAR